MDLKYADIVARYAIKTFGKEHQIRKAKEELFELIVALNSQSPVAIVDEIADVLLTTLQLAQIFGKKECEDRFNFKVNRLSKIVEKKTKQEEAMLINLL